MKSRLLLPSLLLLLLVFPASSLAADTPVQVVKKFNQAVNSHKPDCLYAYSGFRFIGAYGGAFVLRAPVDSKGNLVDWLDESNWTDNNQIYLCTTYLTAYQGSAEDAGSPVWTKTVLANMKLVAISGSVAHVRGKVSHRFKDKKDNYAFTSDIFLVKEQDQWRIANVENLSSRDREAPKSLKGWKKYKAQLGRSTQIWRAKLKQQIKFRKQSESQLGANPEACPGAQSGGKDASDDVFFGSGGDLIPDQEVASVDINDTRLLTKSGEMVLCFKFRSAPSSPYYLSLEALTDNSSLSYPYQGELSIEVIGGKAYVSLHRLMKGARVAIS